MSFLMIFRTFGFCSSDSLPLKYAGRFASAIRATSKKRVPLVSSANPSRFPATEKLWHGKPAQMRSMSGRSFGLMVFASSKYSSCAASKPDIQHRTERQDASILFSVIETKSAIAVFLGVLIQSAKPTSAFLCAVGQFFHDRLHTVEGGGIGKVHFISSFS